jgi:hypothetical protein
MRASATVSTANGKLRKKIQRHDTHWTSAPPAGGPAMVATLVNAVQSPIARPACSAYTPRMSASEFVVRNAPATPCNVRATMRSSPFGAAPARADATAKPAAPAMNVQRRPQRSPTAPPAK